MKVQKSEILAELPKKLADRLMPFQQEGVTYAVNKQGRCLIADEMGLGKTIQAICVSYYYRAEWPLLIIVPSSLRYCWIEEFEKWLPEINPGDINLVQTGSDASGINDAKVTIVTFGLLSKSTSNIVREALIAKQFQVVIVDESHYIRNIKTVSAKTVVPLIKAANRRILLSGTPALARPVELYPQIDAIAPNMFGSWWSYTARYCDAKIEWFGKMKRRNINGASNLTELQQKLSSLLMIRREKDTVLTQLPPKQRQKILFELKQSETTKEIRKTFDELQPLLRQQRASGGDRFEVLTGAGDDVKDTNMLALIQRLYQLSGEAKIGPAREYIEMLCDNPKLKFLVFAYHRAMMNGLSQTLYDRKVKFIRIDGDTPPAERPQLVHQFQSDPDTRVAVLSILAAGVGLTFTAATVVVFAEMYWTPGVMVQCEDRAHRIGQSSCVAVHYLVAKDTMDEWVWSAVCKKTIVTSTTLTGKKKAMSADAGDHYQVDVLSKAEAWVPTENEDLDLSSYFQTHQDSSQKSILDFFSSQKSNVSSPRTPSSRCQQSPYLDTPRAESCTTPASPASAAGKSLLQSPHNCSTAPAGKSKVFSKYFTSKSGTESSQSATASQSSPSLQGGETGREDCRLPCKRARTDSTHSDTGIVVIDSDTDDDFVEAGVPQKTKHTPSSRKSLGSAPGSKKRKRLESSKKSNKYKNRLVALWSRLDQDDDEDCVEVTSLDDANCDTKTDSLNESTKKKLSEHCLNTNKPESLDCSSQKKNTQEIDLDNEVNTETCTLTSSPTNEQPLGKNRKGENKVKTSVKKGKVVSETKRQTLNEEDDNCKKSKEAKEKGQWQCMACTYLNHKELVYCEICETPKKRKRTKDTNEPEAVTDEIVESDDNELGLTKTDEDENIENKEEHTNMEEDQFESSHMSRVSTETRDICEESNVVDDAREQVNDSSGNCKLVESDKLIDDTLTTLKRDSSIIGDALNTPKRNSGQTNGTDSPSTSMKKYRFKSVRKLEGGGGSPVPEKRTVQPAPQTETGSSGEDKENVEAGFDGDQENLLQDSFEDELRESEDKVPGSSEDQRVVNLDGVTVYSVFKYQTSKYTGRIYLFTQAGEPLHVNFVPLDVEVGNLDALPDTLLHPANLRLVQKFVREWTSLSETKRRLVIKAGRVFVSPVREYDDLRSCKTVNTQRHQTKIDTAVMAKKAAASVNGSVRVISRSSGVKQAATGSSSETESQVGVAQAVSEDGTPLCLQCHQPYTNELLTRDSIQSEDNAWQTRFCSHKCSHEYWMLTNSEYLRDKVYEAERGVCQLCHTDAHSFYRHIKDTPDVQKRAELISKSKFNTLAVKTKQQMARKPVAGQFWHADHIKPVWEGGGQCDIDNLRTLCVVCHQKVTARQASKRATVRKLGSAVNSGDITAFFQRS